MLARRCEVQTRCTLARFLTRDILHFRSCDCTCRRWPGATRRASRSTASWRCVGALCAALYTHAASMSLRDAPVFTIIPHPRSNSRQRTFPCLRWRTKSRQAPFARLASAVSFAQHSCRCCFFSPQVLCYLSDQQFDNGHVLEVVDDAHERMSAIRSEKVWHNVAAVTWRPSMTCLTRFSLPPRTPPQV